MYEDVQLCSQRPSPVFSVVLFLSAVALVRKAVKPFQLTTAACGMTGLFRNTQRSRLYRQRLKQDPLCYKNYLEKQLSHVKRYKATKKKRLTKASVDFI